MLCEAEELLAFFCVFGGGIFGYAGAAVVHSSRSVKLHQFAGDASRIDNVRFRFYAC